MTSDRAGLRAGNRQAELFGGEFHGRRSSARPRPAGRSGCVTTAAISWPAASKRRSDGTAKSGVPMKTMDINRSIPLKPQGAL